MICKVLKTKDTSYRLFIFVVPEKEIVSSSLIFNLLQDLFTFSYKLKRSET